MNESAPLCPHGIRDGEKNCIACEDPTRLGIPVAPLTTDEQNHCRDCCCARAWKALGITEYTGLSIPEHIERLRASNDALMALAKRYASECSGCDGTGDANRFLDDSGIPSSTEDCEDCADIRAVIDKAEGRS